MNRRTSLRVIAALALVVLLTPASVFGQQAVQPQPGPTAGVFPTIAQPAARGVAAPAKAPGTELHAPAPRSDRTPQETQQLKQQAVTRRDTGGAEVHYDTTPSPLAPGVGGSFNGLGQNGWIPYDAAIAIGPNHVLEMTNSQWAVYDRSGNQLSINQFDAWWGTQAGTPFDPKCYYDPAADRFVILAVSVDNTQAFYHLSVSQTGNPTGAWFNYQMNARLDGTTNTSNWADFPQLGYDDSAVYISSNQFTLVSNFFQYAKIRVLSKAQLFAGGALNYTDFTGMRNADNSLAFTLQPARGLSSVTSGYFLNSRSSTGSNVTLWRLDNPLSSPSLTRQATVSVGAYSLPPDAPQPNTGTLVATNDARMLELAYRNGILHGVFTESVSGRAAMRYVRIDSSNNNLLKDISYTATGVHYFFPAVSVDSADNVYFVMSRSASTEFASLYHTGMTTADATIQSSALLKAGVSTNTSGRWGDYSGIAIDPADPFAVWAAGGWANTLNRWATWNAQSTFGSGPGNPPTLTAVTPNSGNQGQNVPVTLSGTDFTSNATINVNGSGVTVSNFNFVGSGQIDATFNIAGNAATGPRNVTVTTSAGTSNAQTFTVNPGTPTPALNSLVPNNGLIGSTVPVTLNGSNFDSSAAVNISGSGVAVANLQLASPNQLTADFVIAGNAATGGRTVTVTTTNGTSNGLTFTVNLPPPPTLASISPTVMNPGKTVPATVNGTNFVAGNTTMNFTTGTGVTVQNLNVASPTQFTVDVVLAANASLGGHFFTVTTPAGTSNSRFFDVLREPVINSLAPNSAAPGSSGSLSINGANFYGGSTASVSGSGVTLSNIVRVSNNLITANYSVAGNATSGPRDITVTTLAGVSAPAVFTVTGGPQPPTLNSVAPNSGDQGTNVPVTLTGTNFDASAVINISGTGVTASNVQLSGTTQLTATFHIAANATLGGHNVTVTTNAGTSNAQTFTVNPPAPQPPSLGSLVPNNGLIGSSVSVTLNGSNFDASATVNISGSGVTVSNVQLASPNQLTANFAIAGNAAAGGRTVTVTTNNGTSNGLTFTVNFPPAPTLAAINPAVMNPGKTVAATITGTNFVAGATTMTLTTGTGVTVQNLNVISPTQITVDVVLAANASLGGHRFTVTTPSGTSNFRFFDVLNEPLINSLTPNNAAPGSNLTVNINGANFYGGSTATISGTGVTLTNIVRVSNSLITATFNVAPGASAGPRDVRVVTLAGTSAPVPFTVQ